MRAGADAHLIRRLSESVNGADVVKRDVIAREQAAVHHEHLPSKHRTKRQAAEHLREELHHRLIVLCPNLALEAVQAVHRLRLVVASGEEQAGRVEALQSKESEDDFHRERAAVHKVACRMA